MKKYIFYILVFGLIGLIFGYLFFGKIAGEYVSLKAIFSSSQNALESLGRSISGLAKMKQNILISGGLGAVIGFVIAFLKKK
ncbi:MAG TPA: hypothetical protein P5132_09230 [Bacteroidales bacterium]|nr:hypothetical protein [Bacteroidales bacterium]